MEAYLTVMRPLLAWVLDGIGLLAALAFAWVTITQWLADPEDEEIIPIALRAVGYGMLAVLCRNLEGVIRSWEQSSGFGRAPPLAAFVGPLLTWIGDGAIVLGALVLVWIALRNWMVAPSRWSWWSMLLAVVPVVFIVLTLRSAIRMMATIMQ
jgi:hypothetical protein